MKSPNYNKQYFEGIGYYNNPYNKALVEYLLRYKSKGALLEIGCAEGYFLKYAEKYFKTTGIDISRYAIKNAKLNAKKSKLKVLNVEKDLYKFIKKEKFDVIVALDILEHLKNPEKIIKLIYKSLNKNGIFIFRVPNKSCVDYTFYKLTLQLNKWHGCMDKTHISLYPLNKWKNLSNKVGFKVKILPYTPFKFLKKFIADKFPSLFFTPKIFYFTNTSITFFCIKTTNKK